MSLDEIEGLRHRVSNLFVEHAQVQKIWNELDDIRAELKYGDGLNPPENLFILGESGVGKTQIGKRYAAKYPVEVRKTDRGEIDIKPVVFLELSDPFTYLEFYKAICSALGAPQMVGRMTIGDAERRTLNLLKKQQVEMLILDEVDFINQSRYIRPAEAMELIKHIANTANLSMIFIGRPDAKKLIKDDFQYRRRFPVREIKQFESCNEEFIKLLADMEEKIKPPFPIGLSDGNIGYPQLLHAGCKGLIGFLTKSLEKAYQLLGLYKPEFDDITKAKINANILVEAFHLAVGTILKEEIRRGKN